MFKLRTKPIPSIIKLTPTANATTNTSVASSSQTHVTAPSQTHVPASSSNQSVDSPSSYSYSSSRANVRTNVSKPSIPFLAQPVASSSSAKSSPIPERPRTKNIPKYVMPQQPTKTLYDIHGIVTKIITYKDIANLQEFKFLKKFGYVSSGLLEDDITTVNDEDNGPILKSKNIFFQIRLNRTPGKVLPASDYIICNSVNHFPVQVHDAVFGRVEEIVVDGEKDKRGTVTIYEPGVYFQFNASRLGIVGRSEEAFRHYVSEYTNKKLTPSAIDKLYNRLLAMSDKSSTMVKSELETVFDKLSELSEVQRSDSAEILGTMFGGISGQIIRTLLKNWYWYYLRRRIELIGIERSDITLLINIGYCMTDIYVKIRRNAFVVLPLKLEEAITVKKRLSQTYTDEDVIIAKKARIIYYRVTKDKWTSVPEYDPSDATSDFRPYIDKLVVDYDMVHSLGNLYFRKHYINEVMVANRIVSAIKNIPVREQANVIYSNSKVHSLTEEQKEAVRSAVSYPSSIISGGPGTGKTTIIEQVCENISAGGDLYAITAFTGKAVAHVEEATNLDITPLTIHNMCYGGWREAEPFGHLNVEEVSMVTCEHMKMIYDKFKHEFTTTFIGDINQLPPIENGFFYRQILESGLCNAKYLTKNLRVNTANEDDGIMINCRNLAILIECDRQAIEGIDLFGIDLSKISLKADRQSTNKIIGNTIVSKPVIVKRVIKNKELTLNDGVTEPNELNNSDTDNSEKDTDEEKDDWEKDLEDNNEKGDNNEKDDLKEVEIKTESTGLLSELDHINNLYELYEYLEQKKKMVRERAGPEAERLRREFQFITTPNFQLIQGNMNDVEAKIQELFDNGVESKDLMIISPYNKDINNLNQIAEAIFITDKSEVITCYGTLFYRGDIVAMSRNDYQTNIMNGVSGTVMGFMDAPNRGRIKLMEAGGAKVTHNSGFVQIIFGAERNIKLKPKDKNSKNKDKIKKTLRGAKIRRFFTNEADYEIFKWASAISKCLNIDGRSSEDSDSPNSSSAGRANHDEEGYIISHTGYEWEVVMKVLNDCYRYYIANKRTAAAFVRSHIFARPEVKAIFEPLMRVRYAYGSMKDITLSYAMTTHKGQGSEAEEIVAFIGNTSGNSNNSFLNNCLLNTLISRGKNSVYCIGDINAYYQAATQPLPYRHDALAVRMIAQYKGFLIEE